jgi:putative IMPACT (imprinted ancient) family translation regulator
LKFYETTPNAGHFCYAYQIGQRCNNLREQMMENQAIVLACLFTDKSFFQLQCIISCGSDIWWSKIGVGGLISAYKTTAQMVLENLQLSKND